MTYTVVMRLFATFFLAALAVIVPLHSARADTNPSVCDEVFDLPTTSIYMSASAKVMNPTVCNAYKFLIARYTNPGGCSRLGLTDPQKQGITSLNPNFATALANMLNAASQQGINLGINSAFRTAQAQACANPGVHDSSHMHGCAVDLNYNQSTCTSAACQWVVKNAPAYGLQIRMKYSPEWNHLEPIGYQECKSQNPGGGVKPSGNSTQNMQETYDSSGDPGDTSINMSALQLITGPSQINGQGLSDQQLAQLLMANAQQQQLQAMQQQQLQTQPQQAASQPVTTTATPAATQPSSAQNPTVSPSATLSSSAAPSPTTVSQANTSTTTSPTESSNVDQLLQALAEPLHTPDLASKSVSIPPVSLNEIATLQMVRAWQGSNNAPLYQTTEPSIQQTFPSPTTPSGAQSGFASPQTSAFQAILDNLKSALLNLLDRLTPAPTTSN